VLIPHVGSHHRLVWVTRHELVHAYMLDKLARTLREHDKHQYSMPPLWFVEGLAEFLSTTWDSRADGLLQDAVVSETAYPVSESWPITGTVLMYKEGQSFLLSLAQQYSRRKVMDLLDNWWRGGELREDLPAHLRPRAAGGGPRVVPGAQAALLTARGGARMDRGGGAPADRRRLLRPLPLRRGRARRQQLPLRLPDGRGGRRRPRAGHGAAARGHQNASAATGEAPRPPGAGRSDRRGPATAAGGAAAVPAAGRYTKRQ
jgi:hypothetical protein